MVYSSENTPEYSYPASEKLESILKIYCFSYIFRIRSEEMFLNPYLQ